MSKEEFKQLFLKLTEYTIPFGHESKLEKYLPSGYKKDSIGNYYYEIGNSETLFTTHLDTFSDKYEKVNHVIDEDDPYIIVGLKHISIYLMCSSLKRITMIK